MCLVLDVGYEVKVAESDIVCYKVLEAYYKEMRTAYQRKEVKLGEEYDVMCENFPIIGRDSISSDAFHSYKDKESAEEDFSLYHKKLTMCVVECVIPKGSRYVEGLFKTKPSYASERIRYCKIVRGNEIPENVRFIYEGDEVIGVDFLAKNKRLLFKDLKRNVMWKVGMEYAESLGMTLPTVNEMDFSYREVLKYFTKYLFKTEYWYVWSSTEFGNYDDKWAAFFYDTSGLTNYDIKAKEIGVMPWATKYFNDREKYEKE